MAAPTSDRCSFFVEKKKRFCKMSPARGARFCGEHAIMEGGGSRRVVCPLDPKHTVYQDKLHKHLKKCNSREKPKPVYYVENRNSGSADEDETHEQVSLCERSPAELEALVEKLKAAVAGLPQVEERFLSHAVVQRELSDPKNGGPAHKHLRQQSSILGHLEALGLLGRGRSFVEFGAGRGKLSHWIHQALKTPQDQETTQDLKTPEDLRTPQDLKTPEDLQLLLIERSSTRFKVDGKQQVAGVQFERLQVDIQHLDLSKVPLLQQKRLPVVAVGKHLCGAATDLALRCLLETTETPPPPKRSKDSPPDHHPEPGPGPGPGPGSDPGPGPDLGACPVSDPGPDSSYSSGACPVSGPVSDPVSGPCPDPGPGPGPGPGRVLGLAVALCCHHRCEWVHYVGRRFFRQRGLGPAEFSAFCRMASWATCGSRPANQEGASQEGANQEGDSQEGANQEGANQEGANQEGANQEGANQEGASQEGASQEGSNQEGASQEGANQEGASQEGANQEGANQRGDDEDEHEAGGEIETAARFLSVEARRSIGVLAKLLVDGGRLDFLRLRGFDARLVAFVDAEVTPENVLLTATPTTTPPPPPP